MSAVPETADRRAPAATSAPAAAFGLAVRPGFPCAGLDAPGFAHAGCRVELRIDDLQEADFPKWAGEWVKFGEDRLDDGTVAVTIERHAELGYRYGGPHFGFHLVSADGRLIRLDAEGVDPWLLQRFVIGRLLPLAALLQGLEVFHASAAVLGDRVLACAGGSGAGKSSVATQLIRDGARFFADDAVSFIREPAGLRAYPGSSALTLRSAELDRLPSAQRRRLGRLLEQRDGRAVFAAADRERRALPLGGIYMLDRSRDWARLELVPVADPRYLLACTYDTLIQDAPRLLNLLAICAELARLDLVRVVRVPRACSSEQVADAVRGDFLAR
jgi:hypothetical protein